MHMRRSFLSVPNSGAGLRMALSAVFALASLGLAPATGAQTPIQVLDASGLRPPAGARVAIVEFDDLECPACAAANSTLKAAAAQYKIPWVRHDFLIPYHNWSRAAAIDARWFDLKSKALGDEYRDQVFANQPSIVSPEALRQFTQKFASSHGVALPFAIDPQGKLTAQVKEDYALGQRVGLDHTPTIWVVTASSKGAPFVEVVDRSKLYQMIDEALASTATAAAKTPAKAPAKKSTGK